MSEKKSLRCYICHNQAQEEEEEIPDMLCCPMHGWMPVQFFEVCEGTEDFFEDKQEKESGE